MSDVFAELKRLINRSPMPIGYIAAKSGLNPLTLRCWLDGKIKEPRLDSLIRVAELFDRRIELIGGKARFVPDTPTSVAAKASQAREFVGIWRRYQ